MTFAAFIHPDNPTSGAYGGLSFVIFPAGDQPCLLGMAVGTGGVSPDEAILGRPGHARKVQAILFVVESSLWRRNHGRLGKTRPNAN